MKPLPQEVFEAKILEAVHAETDPEEAMAEALRILEEGEVAAGVPTDSPEAFSTSLAQNSLLRDLAAKTSPSPEGMSLLEWVSAVTPATRASGL